MTEAESAFAERILADEVWIDRFDLGTQLGIGARWGNLYYAVRVNLLTEEEASRWFKDKPPYPPPSEIKPEHYDKAAQRLGEWLKEKTQSTLEAMQS